MALTFSLITATHYRAEMLAERALPSVLGQTANSFEWIVVNDGSDPATRELIHRTRQERNDIGITYCEIDHAPIGFGLCHARNRGLEVASGSIVAYLDDDNTLEPSFVVEMLRLFREIPDTKMSMARQRRRRDVMDHGQIIRRGSDFEAPKSGTSIETLIRMQDIFDSNGFCHHKSESLRWQANYRVFADYEFLLQCVSHWKRDRFKLNDQLLIEYIQSSEGTIGQSNFGDWAAELLDIEKNRACYPVLAELASENWLPQMVTMYKDAHAKGLLLPGFSAE